MHSVLEPGKYKAVDTCTVMLYHHNRKVSWTEHKAGETIDIPVGVNGHRSCLEWWDKEYDCPDTGGPMPRLEKIG